MELEQPKASGSIDRLLKRLEIPALIPNRIESFSPQKENAWIWALVWRLTHVWTNETGKLSFGQYGL
jgi:hypothetical protein